MFQCFGWPMKNWLLQCSIFLYPDCHFPTIFGHHWGSHIWGRWWGQIYGQGQRWTYSRGHVVPWKWANQRWRHIQDHGWWAGWGYPSPARGFPRGRRCVHSEGCERGGRGFLFSCPHCASRSVVLKNNLGFSFILSCSYSSKVSERARNKNSTQIS